MVELSQWCFLPPSLSRSSLQDIWKACSTNVTRSQNPKQLGSVALGWLCAIESWLRRPKFSVLGALEKCGSRCQKPVPWPLSWVEITGSPTRVEDHITRRDGVELRGMLARIHGEFGTWRMDGPMKQESVGISWDPFCEGSAIVLCPTSSSRA